MQPFQEYGRKLTISPADSHGEPPFSIYFLYIPLQSSNSTMAMADEEIIVVNGVEVIKPQGTCNYGSWLATLRRALEVPDPKSWRLITDKNSAPETNRECPRFCTAKILRGSMLQQKKMNRPRRRQRARREQLSIRSARTGLDCCPARDCDLP